MNQWLGRCGVAVYASTSGRRGVLGLLGRTSAGIAAAGITLASGGTAHAAAPASDPAPRAASPNPIFLPKGQKAARPLTCGSCGGTAEYVCSHCCVGGSCCPNGDLYRQACYDDNCNPYYTYWCA